MPYKSKEMDPQFVAFVQNMNETNRGEMRQMMEMFNQTLQSLTRETSRGGMVDVRGIGKPGSFKGDEAKYQEWIAK